MMTPLQAVVLVVLTMILVGALPQMHDHPFGYAPSGTAGFLLLLIVLLLVCGRI